MVGFAGNVVFTVQVYVVAWLVLPAASPARTENVCWPSASAAVC